MHSTYCFVCGINEKKLKLLAVLLQLLELKDEDVPTAIDVIIDDRDKYGSTKMASSMKSTDVLLLLQSMWLNHYLGSWHASLGQFMEGIIYFLIVLRLPKVHKTIYIMLQ